MPILALLRHGQSVFNAQNIFTGWLDVPLSEQGIKEAEVAKEILKAYDFDVVFVSALARAKETALIVCQGQKNIKLIENAALNERHYGDLQGQNKEQMRLKYGKDQVLFWRRSFEAKPPGGESLKDTCLRVIPYYQTQIEPLLKEGQNVLVCAHGNSLRALIKYIENISSEDIINLEVLTGLPLIYKVDSNEKRYTKLLPTNSN